MMKKLPFCFIVLCLLVLASGCQLKACSVFNASRIDKVYAATNKDWNNTETRILFIPPSDNKYGRVYFGYQIPEGFQNVGGMNDQGLWYDGASLPSRSDIFNHFNKPTVKGELCEKALEECATVEEVIQMYEHYYSPHWQGHSMWADRYGNSVIIEYGEKDVVCVKKEHGFQVMTNHYISDPENNRWYNCHRFNAITEILENGGELTVGLMTTALDAAHKVGITPTLYSNVYDLKNGEIYIYHFHNYEEVVCLNLAEQLAKEDLYLELPGLFHGIRLKSPVVGEVVDGSKVSFHWSGGADSYSLCCSADKSFTDCAPVELLSLQAGDSHLLGFSSVMILALIAGLFCRVKKRSLIPLLCGLIFLGSCVGCSKIFVSPTYPPSVNASTWVKDLEPGTKYYWKVVAHGNTGINSESVVRTFTTVE